MFGPFRRTRKKDPHFGNMLYMGDQLKYWEGKANFGPLQQEVEYFVDGGPADSMETQHTFLKIVSQHWRHWFPAIEEKVKIESGVTAAEDLRLSSISIPNSSYTDEIDWEVSFAGQRSGSVYVVQMKGHSPQEVTRDS